MICWVRGSDKHKSHSRAQADAWPSRVTGTDTGMSGSRPPEITRLTAILQPGWCELKLSSKSRERLWNSPLLPFFSPRHPNHCLSPEAPQHHSSAPACQKSLRRAAQNLETLSLKEILAEDKKGGPEADGEWCEGIIKQRLSGGSGSGHTWGGGLTGLCPPPCQGCWQTTHLLINSVFAFHEKVTWFPRQKNIFDHQKLWKPLWNENRNVEIPWRMAADQPRKAHLRERCWCNWWKLQTLSNFAAAQGRG